MSRLLSSTKLDFLDESDVSAELPSKAARSGTISRAHHGSGAALRKLRRATPRWPKLSDYGDPAGVRLNSLEETLTSSLDQ